MLKSVQYAIVALGFGAAWLAAHSSGSEPRFTGAPGDAPRACATCHVGSLNSGAGSVKIMLPNGPSYVPGVKQRVTVQVTDPQQSRWGFQLTARADSNPARAQAGTFAPVDGFTQVLCETGARQPCPAETPVEYVEQTIDGTRAGTQGGVTYDFDWTPPAGDLGKVTFYVAALAADGNGTPYGDNTYTASLKIDSPTSASSGSPTPETPATHYAVKNLVSDVQGLADVTDPNLVNAWGISVSASSPFWISNNHTGTTTVYNTAGQPFPTATPLVVKIPVGKNGDASAGSPTGQVNNNTKAFELSPGKPASFIFATEDGTISAWNGGATATVKVDKSATGAEYKGLAIGISRSGPRLYAANFRGGTIDVFDGNFQPVASSGGFLDPNIPRDFSPFNIQRFGNNLYVTYAKPDAEREDDVRGNGNGYVDVFDLDGNLHQRLVSNGVLNSPWGLAMATSYFGDFSNALLVGNSGDGHINAFNPVTGEHLGTLRDKNGDAITIEGLWGLLFGNNKNGGDANTLYFTAGIAYGGAVEDHGLLGAISIAP